MPGAAPIMRSLLRLLYPLLQALLCLRVSASARGACKSIACEGTSAPGSAAVALNYATTASGLNAVAMGFDTLASGSITTAFGSNTTASGDFGTAMGYSTVANCGATEPSNWQACVAMGFNINNTESEALAVSGNVHARNVKIFGADQRLVQNITDADPHQLLANLEKVRVVNRAFSKNYCRHQGKRRCASAVGLLSQQVEKIIPDAVSTGASLTLVDPESKEKLHSVLENVEDVKGLDMHAMISQLVGAVQALSKQNKELLDRVAFLEDSHNKNRKKQEEEK